MRVLMLSQWFQPEPFFKGVPLAKALLERGCDVEVLTGFPNYPGGKLYSGYRIVPWQRDRVEGIEVWRVALYPSHDKSAGRRILNYISFALSAAFFGPFLVKPPDVIYIYNLVTLVFVGWWFRLIWHSKLVLDVQDLWPESILNSGMLKANRIRRVMTWLCSSLYRSVDRIVALSPGFKAELVAKGVSEDLVTVIYNWCDEVALKNTDIDISVRERFGLQNKLVIVFAGTMGILQGLDTVLDAAQICSSNGSVAHFMLIGGGVDQPRLEKRSRDLELTNVSFIPFQAPTEMGAYYAAADVLLVHLRDDPLFDITIPSKTQAYLYVGKPILMAVKGDAADLAHKSGSAICCDPGNAQALANAVAQFEAMSPEGRCEMGLAGSTYYDQNLSLTTGANNLYKVLCAVNNHAT